MSAITYLNRKTTLPNWVETLHQTQQIGYAYESDEHYVHIYGCANNLWVISTGLTASEKKNDGISLTDWSSSRFGAERIQTSNLAPGEVITGVWRPGLHRLPEIYQALNTQEHEQRTAEQSLRILIEKLDDILLYIEPTVNGLLSYGHKTRELLILACTEVEQYWTQYMRVSNSVPAGRAFTTNDYIKLLTPLHLTDYEVSFKQSNYTQSIRPFENWDRESPTQSLNWYDAYNKTKHDRSLYFGEATLRNCLHALSAAISLFCARYSPLPLIHGNGSVAALFNQHFLVQLINPDRKSFYVPKIKLPRNIRSDFVCGNSQDFVAPWEAKPLVL